MKKISTIILMIAACAALIPTLVLAEEALTNESIAQDQWVEPLDISFSDLDMDEGYEEDLISSDNSEDRDQISENDIDSSYFKGRRYVKVRGKWGHGTDPEPDGYWGGRISLRKGPNGNRVGVFAGLYNTSDSEDKSRLVGIMKKGYFNGKIINQNGTELKLTGLYVVDRENQVLKMQWMVPGHGGWAGAKVMHNGME